MIQFLPGELDSCTMQVWLLGPAGREGEGQTLMAEMFHFLAEDR